jgi:hypothetical protein
MVWHAFFQFLVIEILNQDPDLLAKLEAQHYSKPELQQNFDTSVGTCTNSKNGKN